MIRRLLYISTIRSDLTRSQVASILATSRVNNARDGISGLLVVGTKRFMQLLEGPPEAVGATLERIKRDDRHMAVVTLADRTGEHRLFADWAMGEVSLQGEDRSEAEFLDAMIANIADGSLRAEFQGFAALQGKAA